jgi:CDP-diacylglycerol--glycerol-3-phosphate 3-phosphatidyltransferase
MSNQTCHAEIVSSVRVFLMNLEKIYCENYTCGELVSLWTLPNLISMLRIVLTPVIIALLMQTTQTTFWFSVGLFTVAALSDYWDGYFARRLRNVSAFGAYLDPLADKILVLGLFAAFAYDCIITPGLFLIFASRDVLLTGLRSIVAARGFNWQTSYVAKSKTVLQFVVLYGGYGVVATRLGLISLPLQMVHNIFLWIVWAIAALTLYTAIDYIVRYRDTIELLIIKSTMLIPVDKALLGIATLGFAWVRVPAPGTVASIIATVGAYFVLPFFGPFNAWVGLCLGILFFLGWVCASRAAQMLHNQDPSIVVIDEVVAMFMVCYLFAQHSIILYGFACLVFRVFDIFKPYPVNVLDKCIKGGFGIMLDDLAAGAYTLLVVFIFLQLA